MHRKSHKGHTYLSEWRTLDHKFVYIQQNYTYPQNQIHQIKLSTRESYFCSLVFKNVCTLWYVLLIDKG